MSGVWYELLTTVPVVIAIAAVLWYYHGKGRGLGIKVPMHELAPGERHIKIDG